MFTCISRRSFNRINRNNFCIRIKIQKFLHGIRAIADLEGSPAKASEGSSYRKLLKRQQKSRSEGTVQFLGADSRRGKGDVIQHCVLASPRNYCVEAAQKHRWFGLKPASVIQINLSDPEKTAEKLQKFRRAGGVKILKFSNF